MTTKAQKIKRVNKDSMLVSLDIGKTSHFGYFRAPDGQDIRPFEFKNNRDGFLQFWHRLCRFKNQHGLTQVMVGFESTGPYAEPLIHFIKQKPVQLVQINPTHSKRLKELTGNSPNKTDRKDPKVIADVMMLGHYLTVVLPQGAAAQLRRLTHARERAIKQRTATLNQLQDLVFIIFPEFCGLFKSFSCKTSLHLLSHYPTPEALGTLDLQQLSRTMRRVSRGRFNHQHAQRLLQAANASVGIREASQSITEEIRHLVEQLHTLDGFVQQLEQKMHLYLDQIPFSTLLLSMPGIGLITVAGLIGEVGDFRNFATRSEIIKMAGLDLFEISSGKHQGRRHISKRGRPLMRKLLYFAAINTVKKNGIMHAPYTRMVERGMPKIKALVAISRKLLAVMFALVRDQSMFIKDYNAKSYKLAA
jgi:transposase